MRRVLFSVAVGVITLGGLTRFATPAEAQDPYHDRYHDDFQRRAYPRYPDRREALRYPMTWGQHEPPRLPAQVQPPARNGYLQAAIAAGAPFRAQLNPGESNGSLVGGATYDGRYDPRCDTFTVSGPGLAADGCIDPITAAYRGGNPLVNEINLFGAGYGFDDAGHLFVGTSGRLAGRLWLAQP